jgi:hypothetical protein
MEKGTGDMETWRHGHIDTWTWTHGHMNTWTHRDTDTWRHGHMETWTHGHIDKALKYRRIQKFDEKIKRETENGSSVDFP